MSTSFASRRARALGLAWALLACALPARAQGETGFLRGRGRFDLATSYSRDSTDEFELSSGAQIEGVTREIFGLYAAYGLRDDLDLVFNGAYVRAAADDPAFRDESGLQDGALQAKWRVHERALGPGRLSWLLAPGLRVPLDDYATFADNAVNGLGEGDTVLLGRTVVHYQLGNSYAALETGYDHRSGRLDDEIPLHLSLGTALGARTTLQAFYTSLFALGDTVSNPLLSDEQDGFQRIGLGLYVRLGTHLGLALSVRRSDDGESVSDGFSLGTVFRR